MGFKVLMLVVSLMAVGFSAMLAILGFMGHLSPIQAGLGWVLATLLNISGLSTYIREVSKEARAKESE